MPQAILDIDGTLAIDRDPAALLARYAGSPPGAMSVAQ
jgi:hypothetical protein